MPGCLSRSIESYRGHALQSVDGNSATHRGLRLLATEDRRWQNVEVRARRYLNNVVERDHRAIKQRCAPMLGLKSFRSAAITLAGVELAHRVRKQQYSLPKGMKGRAGSLKELWDAALADSGAPMCRDGDRPTPTHQNSADHFQPARGRVHPEGRVRYPRKISFGGNLYLLVRPQGGRYWHYHYRYGGKRKTLSLGTYPDVPIAGAQSRHRAARRLLAAGVDPSLMRRELRRLESAEPDVGSGNPGKWLRTAQAD